MGATSRSCFGTITENRRLTVGEERLIGNATIVMKDRPHIMTEIDEPKAKTLNKPAKLH